MRIQELIGHHSVGIVCSKPIIYQKWHFNYHRVLFMV